MLRVVRAVVVPTIVAAASVPSFNASAQATGGTRVAPGGTAARADSARILRDARAAQARFETVRRHHLPKTWGAPGGSCDERIGRFCYWDDSDGTEDVEPDSIPPESPRIGEARAALLTALDSAGRALPGDDWISAHHVRYLIEAGRFEAAVARARGCGATSWWCEALEGMALHVSGRFAESDSVFARALAAMPEAVRCEWDDLSDLLVEPVLQPYRTMSCAERAAFNQRLWWLADPLHSQPGNDRRTEHYTRAVLDRLQRRTPSGYNVQWGSDIGQLLFRYGWPSYFAQDLPRPMRNDPPGILAYHRDASYHFFPEGRAPEDLRATDDETWTLRGPRQRERYAPLYATFATLEQQTTLFRRGDSLLILAAYDVTRDTLFADGPLTAALVASDDPASAGVAAMIRHDAPRRGTLIARAPDTALVASVEIIGGNRVRRARLAVRFADTLSRRVRISGLALFDPATLAHADSLPADLDALRAAARSSATIPRDEKVGLFWELYGVAATDDRLTLRVEVVREGRSWLRRAGERIGVLGRDGGVRLGWREAPRDPAAIIGRSVVVDLSSLDPGRYRIEVQVGLEGMLPATASRTIEVTR